MNKYRNFKKILVIRNSNVILLVCFTNRTRESRFKFRSSVERIIEVGVVLVTYGSVTRGSSYRL